MINNICSFYLQTLKIIEETVKCLKEGRKILILSDRREHLSVIKAELDKTTYTSGF